MTRQDLIDHCLTYPGAYEDYPFKITPDCAAMRHRTSRKCFAFIYDRKDGPHVHLKLPPMEADFLREAYEDALPGQDNWLTVRLGGDVPVEELMRMVGNSDDLTKPKVSGHVKVALPGERGEKT